MIRALDSVLVVLPARGGSKRILHKNIKQMCGKAMIYWPLREILQIFPKSNIIVSTDSERIASHVRKLGIAVPFLRPASLADDHTDTFPVVQHALNWFEEMHERVDLVLTVYPTAVLLSSSDILSSVSMILADESCDMVISATSFPFPIQRAVFENSSGYAEMLQPENFSVRSQDLQECFHDAGQFYLSRASAIRAGKFFVGAKVRLHKIHRNNVVDIDTIEDFEVAEQKLSSKLVLGASRELWPLE